MNALVDYSSDSDEEPEGKAVRNQISASKKLPLPSCFLNSLKKEEVFDNPEENEGRVRSFPHQRGNWASLVYIPYNHDEELSILVERLIVISDKIPLKPVLEPHISLTRTFVLLYHWIQEFISTIKFSLIKVNSFRLEFKDLDIYVNDESTRTFLGLTVSIGSNNISQMVKLLDNCLLQYKLKPFYEEERFHMSICWCLGDERKYFQSILPSLQDTVCSFISEYPHTSIVDVNKFICKIGNKIFEVPLNT